MKVIIFLSGFVFSLAGCVIVPQDIYDTTWTIDSGSFETIFLKQSLRNKKFHLKDRKVDIYLKDHVCPCSNIKVLRMKVSEFNIDNIRGDESQHYILPIYGISNPDAGDFPVMCKTYWEAKKAIYDASVPSKRGHFIYTPSFELIWEADRAIRPPECDPVRAKILAEKSKQIAEDEGRIALGFDITGTYISEVSGELRKYFKEMGQIEPKLRIEQNGSTVTGKDFSGNVILKGHRTDESEIRSVIKFKFFIPHISRNELEGEWVVDGLSIKGSWKDPVNNVSGTWNLWNATEQKFKAENADLKSEKLMWKWWSSMPMTEVNFEDVERINVWVKKVGHWHIQVK